MHKDIPCADCDRERQRLQDMGFQVHGCEPIAGRPGFCRIEFEDPPAAAAPAALGAAGAGAAVAADTGAPRAAPAAASTPRRANLPAAGLTPTQAATGQAIVNIFETSAVLGEYGQVTLIPGDSGHLTFGRSQTTLGSGLLAQLLRQYCANPGAVFGARLAPFLRRFEAIDLSLDADLKLHNLLRATADDRIMRETQDAFFDARFWQPALRAANRLGIVSPLGVAVVYDSHVHGSWPLIQGRTTAEVGNAASAGEQRWITAYVAQRHRWLENHPRRDLQKTVYRMEAFERLIAQDQWGLPLPLVVRGAEISTASLSAMPPGCWDGPLPGSRSLALATPLLRGLDVRRVQLALSDRDVDIRADGVYGRTSMLRVQAFQSSQGLPASGILDADTIVHLVA